MDNPELINDTKLFRLGHPIETSTGIGLAWKNPKNRNNESRTYSLGAALPMDLIQDQERLKELYQPFETNYKAEFQNYSTTPLARPIHKKAPSLHKVHYLQNIHKLQPNLPGWYRPLNGRGQLSEYQEEISATAIKSNSSYQQDQPDFELNDFLNDGPSKRVIATTKNRSSGQVFYPKNKEVLRMLDPYISTTQKDHRAWNEEESGPRSLYKNDILTYWDMEEVHTRKPKLPYLKDPGKLINEVEQDNPEISRLCKIKQRTVPFHKLTRHPLCTVYSDSYETPTSELSKFNPRECLSAPFPMNTPQTREPALPSNMYQTEAQTLGKNQTILI